MLHVWRSEVNFESFHSLYHVVGFSVLNSGHQAQWQVPLPSESLPCPKIHFVAHVGLEFVVILLSLLPK